MQDTTRILSVILAGTSQEVEGVMCQLLLDGEGIDRRTLEKWKYLGNEMRSGCSGWNPIMSLAEYILYTGTDREHGYNYLPSSCRYS